MIDDVQISGPERTPTSRALSYLGLSDDAPRPLRFSSRWWVRTAVIAAVFSVVVVLVAVGG